MRKTIAILTIFLGAVTLLGAQNMAVATVRLEKTEPISGAQLNETVALLEQQQGRALTAAEKKEVLDEIINQILIIQAAEADRNVSVTTAEVEQAGMRLLSQQLQQVGAIPPGAILTDKMQYRQVVQQQGMSVEEFENSIRKQLLAEKYITMSRQSEFQSIGSATPAELNTEYQRRVSEFVVSDSVWFNHIFFSTNQSSPAEARAKGTKAQEVYRRLMNTPATFSELVASESEDEASKARGGLIGPVMKGDAVAEQLYGSDFMETLFTMDVGETSEVLKSNVGYHIIQLTEKKAAQLLPKDDPEVRNYLEQIIYARKYQIKFDQVASVLVEELRDRATINYLGEYR
jgi:parvulin-like peptidyl-prolyl isomerase